MHHLSEQLLFRLGLGVNQPGGQTKEGGYKRARGRKALRRVYGPFGFGLGTGIRPRRKAVGKKRTRDKMNWTVTEEPPTKRAKTAIMPTDLYAAIGAALRKKVVAKESFLLNRTGYEPRAGGTMTNKGTQTSMDIDFPLLRMHTNRHILSANDRVVVEFVDQSDEAEIEDHVIMGPLPENAAPVENEEQEVRNESAEQIIPPNEGPAISAVVHAREAPVQNSVDQLVSAEDPPDEEDPLMLTLRGREAFDSDTEEADHDSADESNPELWKTLDVWSDEE